MMIRGFFTTFLMKQRLGIFGFGKASLGLGLLLISINSDLSVSIFECKNTTFSGKSRKIYVKLSFGKTKSPGLHQQVRALFVPESFVMRPRWPCLPSASARSSASSPGHSMTTTEDTTTNKKQGPNDLVLVSSINWNSQF